MNFKTFHKASKMITAVNRELGDVDVVSFDVFDTLLVRRVHDPDLVKVPVARLISSLAEQGGIEMSWQEVQERRNKIEQAFRDETGKSHPDHEAHYPTVMTDTLKSILGDHFGKDTLERVTDYEILMENAMLVPRQDIFEWIEELVKSGKRLFAISDMYFPATHISRLLEHAGLLDKFEQVVSSADSFRAKASGEGYDLVKEKFNLDPQRWIHVGDNAISDGLRPAEKGIRSFILQDPEEFRRRAIAARYYFYSRNRAFWRGRVTQQLMAPLQAENVDRSVLYTEGYNFIGPLVAMFVQSVAEHCRKNDITKIFFLSREGWMFKEVWDKTMPYLFPDEQLPEVEYLYVSRLALAGATCSVQGLTPDNCRIVFLPPGNKNFNDVCRIFNLEGEPLDEHLARHDLTRETTLSPLHPGFDAEHSWRLEKLLKDDVFQDEIRRQTGPQNASLQKYLQSVGFYEHKDVALVDIGWLGTIQRFFYHGIKHREDRPNCHGLLFGATRGIPFDTRDDNHIQGLIFDRSKFDLAASSISYARDLFEEACRAPHPTTVGYRDKEDGSAVPVFRDMTDTLGKSEREQDQHYADLQKGILDAADRYGAASTIIASNTEGYRAWINYLLVSKLAFAKRREIRALRYMHHLDDFHGVNKPRIRRMPKLFHNPWETTGFRHWFGSLFPGRVFRAHLRTMVTK